MFIDSLLKHNPDLARAAFALHSAGEIGPNTYVVDLDAVAQNALKLVEEARRQGLELYLMTKQFGRNPLVTHVAARAGLDSMVTVDVDEAKRLAASGFKLGHVGHLVQIPNTDLEQILGLEPEVMTVFSLEKARHVSAVAGRLGLKQALLIRVRREGDFFYPAQEGGVPYDQLVDVAREIQALPNVYVTGVTSHPCLLYSEREAVVEAMPNLHTLTDAARLLQQAGIEISQINTPSVSTVSTMKLLKEHGSTHAEPGSALIGSTPLHAFTEQPELPAMVYISEVSHLLDDKASYYGGGLYPRSRMQQLLVGRTWEELISQRVLCNGHPSDNIDYHGSFTRLPGVEVGDTVLGAFRTQVFVTRSRLAAVSGIQSGQPRLWGIYDQHGNLLNKDGIPAGPAAEADLFQRFDAEGGRG